MGWLPQASHSRIKEERTEEMKTWLKPQSVRDIQLLQRSHWRLHRIAMPLTSILRTTDEPTGNKPQSTKVKNQDISSAGSAGVAGSANGAGESNKNLSSTGKLKNRARPFWNGSLYSWI